MAAMSDADDDVSAVAAEALLPAAAAIAHTADEETLRKLLTLLWERLVQLDDLSPSTGR